MATSAVAAFVDNPSCEALEGLRKADLLEVAGRYDITVRKQALKAEVLAIVKGSLLEQGVLTLAKEEEDEDEDGRVEKELATPSPARSVISEGEAPVPRTLPRFNPVSPDFAESEEVPQLRLRVLQLEADLKDSEDQKRKLDWETAEQKCIELGAHLLVVNSQDEQDYISKVVQGNEHYWIGLVERTEEGNWTWVDGTAYKETPKFWDNGQPDNWHVRVNGEDCGQLHPKPRAAYRKLWNDADCTLLFLYICEAKGQ
ncbi:hypothetical protein UPYG_G00186050 [Umbra pygmaea]|uniref:C-type lectin domain-containing protein n=1 Tax=Umbra pygmaea TaxID=75934 RepID=A0ABD0WSF1_UMBPY